MHTRLKIEFITEKGLFFSLCCVLCCVVSVDLGENFFKAKGKAKAKKKGPKIDFSPPLSPPRLRMMIDHCAEHRIQFLRQLSNLYRHLIHF